MTLRAGRCQGCLEKSIKIDKLRRENEQLRDEVASLRRKTGLEHRTIDEAPFGSSTPSARLPVKPNSPEQNRASRGGARPGHKGHGRRSIAKEDADRVQRVPLPQVCPECGAPMRVGRTRQRSVVDCRPLRMERVVYELERGTCSVCRARRESKAPSVLPKCRYGNQLLALVAVEHCLNGMTLGQIEARTRIGYGALVDALHQLARRLKDVPEYLVGLYRQAYDKHADETTWRTDGANGYAWLFCTSEVSIFRFRQSRAARIAQEVLGSAPLPGVLSVDRYGGYNRAPCDIQYCYAHLKRDVEDLLTEFPGNAEVRRFVDTLAPLLSAAMGLRSLPIDDTEFRRQASHLRRRIVQVCSKQAQHPGIQHIQGIFRQHARRLYHWARDRRVPADNNLAERELRPLVVARKNSFGSQSEAGAHTREILMTVLHSLRKRVPDPMTALKATLDTLAQDPNADPISLLFPPMTT